jgi:hypothetical protein
MHGRRFINLMVVVALMASAFAGVASRHAVAGTASFAIPTNGYISSFR